MSGSAEVLETRVGRDTACSELEPGMTFSSLNRGKSGDLELLGPLCEVRSVSRTSKGSRLKLMVHGRKL